MENLKGEETPTEAENNETQENQLPQELMDLLTYYGDGDPEAIKRPEILGMDEVTGAKSKAIKRLQFGFHANGCERLQKAIQNQGMATCYMFCDFAKLASTIAEIRGKAVRPVEFIEQGETAAELIRKRNEELAGSGGKEVSRVDIYIGGSELNERELGAAELETIYRNIAGADNAIKEIGIETRVEHINDEKLDALDRMAAETETTAVLAMGVESMDREVLRRSRKMQTPEQIKKALLATLERENLVPQADMLMKPLVMRDDHAIKLALQDMEELRKVVEEYRKAHEGEEKATGKKIAVHLAPLSPKKGTGADILEAYKPVNLWSLIDFVKKLPPETFEYLTINIGVDSETETVSDDVSAVTKEVTSCPECKEELLEALQEFSSTQDKRCVEGLSCDCQTGWQKELKIPFSTAFVTVPQDKANPDPYKEAVFQDQLDGIMSVDKECYEEGAGLPTREEMEKRLRTPGNKTIVNYDEKGEIVAFYMANILRKEDIDALPVEKRGWDNIKALPVKTQEEGGNTAFAMSISAKPTANSGAALVCFYRMITEIILPNKFEGGIGISRIPALANAKNQFEEKTGRELTREELFEFANQFVDIHYARISEDMKKGTMDNSEFDSEFTIGDRTERVKHPMDEDLRYEGRILFPQRGVVVQSMDTDPESCGLGVYYRPSLEDLKRIQKTIKMILRLK